MKPIGIIGTTDDEQSKILLEKAKEMSYQTEFIDLGAYRNSQSRNKRFGRISNAFHSIFNSQKPKEPSIPDMGVGIFCSYGTYDESFRPNALFYFLPELLAAKFKTEREEREKMIRKIENGVYVVCSPVRMFSAEKDYLFSLESKGVKIPKTVITGDSTVAKKQIKEFCEKDGKAVLKPSDGSLGVGATLFQKDDPKLDERIEDVVDDFFNPEYTGVISLSLSRKYLVQEFIPTPKRKIRTLSIGHEPITAAYYLCLDKDWKSANSFHYPNRDGYRKPCKMNDEVREISRDVSETLEADVIGIDILERVNPSGKIEDYVVCDANSPSHWHGLIPVSEVDIPRKIIEYALKHAKN